jgi:adenylosuccinate lyase
VTQTPRTADHVYQNPLTERYASEEMSRIFSAAEKHGAWRRLWIALAEAEAELGLPIPPEAIAEMRAQTGDIDFKRAAELEKRFRHDVMAHVHLFGEAAPSAKAFIHLGATSAFVTDNSEMLQHTQALQLVLRRLVSCVAALTSFAKQHRDLPTLGYTHFQPAQPTTVGKRATLWLQDFLLDIEEIEHRLATIRYRGIRGTTGTEASFLELFDGDHGKVEELGRRVAQKMGFDRLYGVTGQTYPRKTDYALLASLAGVAASASKYAHDLRLLQHLKEIEEPFEKEQIGSSAMAYKRNPMRAERITALARHVIALTIDPAFTAATQWLERTLDDSANRRIAIPESYLATDAMLILVHNVSSGLVVRQAIIKRHLEDELPFMATEAILMHAVRAGGDRQELHERIRQHSMAAGDMVKDRGEANDLADRIAGDAAFKLTRADVETVLDPARHTGRAAQQVDAFLRDHVAPVLARYDVTDAVPELKA